MTPARVFPFAMSCALLLAAVAEPASAHHAPNSFVRLDFRAASVLAEIMVPASELAYAMAAPPTTQSLAPYLLRHVAAASPQGADWVVRIAAVRASTYLEQPYFVAEVEFVPPPGGSAREFVLTIDAVTHEVRNHVVVVVAEHDYADTTPERAPQLLGALQYPARQLVIRRPVISADRRQARVPAR
jgi:hypothetical protein